MVNCRRSASTPTLPSPACGGGLRKGLPAMGGAAPVDAEGDADVAANAPGAAKPEMALRRRLRCPSGTPSFSRSTPVSSGRTSASISLARKSASYCPRPRLLSQPPTSMCALHGPEGIIRRLKRPVQGWALQELWWVMMTHRYCPLPVPVSLEEDKENRPRRTVLLKL